VTQFIYLHGFASGPGSKKATEFKKRFNSASISLTVPDLEGGDFQRLSLTKQLKIVDDCMGKVSGEPVGLIGSSMGGYLAALTAQMHEEVAAIYLMAPGFNFMKRWRDRVQGHLKGSNVIPDLIPVYHYRYNKDMLLSADIFRDAEKWDCLDLNRKLPTRIVHGIHDDTVDISESRKYTQTRPWCQLQELDSDHQLLSHIDWIVEDALNFFQNESLL
jgi:pimeloyl-ACP methyl ester carboxylesterase